VAGKRKNVSLLRRPINQDAKMRKRVQKRCSVALRQASSALAHDECIAHFEPPQTRNARLIGADALKRQRSDRMVFVIESPARSDGGIEHEGHQYLCPSCLAETSSSAVIFPVRCRNAFMFAIALSISASLRCASGSGRTVFGN
jgi:hypothetical protein